jgi:hypothetical protein
LEPLRLTKESRSTAASGTDLPARTLGLMCLCQITYYSDTSELIRHLGKEGSVFAVSKRVGSGTKTRSKSKAIASAQPRPWTLFDHSPLLEGEDPAAYNQLVRRIRAAVKPADVIDKMFTADIVSLEWEILRWRRLKWSLVRARGLEALKSFLAEHLDCHTYQEEYLLEVLRAILPEDQVDSAQVLVDQWQRGEDGAIDKIDKVLASNELNFTEIQHHAAAQKVKELMREYVKRDLDAIAEVEDLLTSAGTNIDSFMADALAEKLYQIQRIDQLTAIAESRRNDRLKEIDRRRPVHGEAPNMRKVRDW